MHFLAQSVEWLESHPNEAAARAVPQSTEFQPLAELLPRLVGKVMRRPRHLQVFLDDDFVRAIKSNDDEHWAEFWVAATKRALNVDSPAVGGAPDSNGVNSASEARDAVVKAGLLIGFHADQATEACVDLAILLNIPFAICPCCVFPAEFPDRKLPDGRRVSKYPEFMEYLQNKHPNIKTAELPFAGVHRHELDPALAAVSPSARSTVLYMLPGDFTM